MLIFIMMMAMNFNLTMHEKQNMEANIIGNIVFSQKYGNIGCPT